VGIDQVQENGDCSVTKPHPTPTGIPILKKAVPGADSPDPAKWPATCHGGDHSPWKWASPRCRCRRRHHNHRPMEKNNASASHLLRRGVGRVSPRALASRSAGNGQSCEFSLHRSHPGECGRTRGDVSSRRPSPCDGVGALRWNSYIGPIETRFTRWPCWNLRGQRP